MFNLLISFSRSLTCCSLLFFFLFFLCKIQRNNAFFQQSSLERGDFNPEGSQWDEQLFLQMNPERREALSSKKDIPIQQLLEVDDSGSLFVVTSQTSLYSFSKINGDWLDLDLGSYGPSIQNGTRIVKLEKEDNIIMSNYKFMEDESCYTLYIAVPNNIFVCYSVNLLSTGPCINHTTLTEIPTMCYHNPLPLTKILSTATADCSSNPRFPSSSDYVYIGGPEGVVEVRLSLLRATNTFLGEDIRAVAVDCDGPKQIYQLAFGNRHFLHYYELELSSESQYDKENKNSYMFNPNNYNVNNDMNMKFKGSSVRFERYWFVGKQFVKEIKYTTAVGGMVDGNITALQFDAFGVLWVGTDDCLNLLLPDLSFRRIDSLVIQSEPSSAAGYSDLGRRLPVGNITGFVYNKVDYHSYYYENEKSYSADAEEQPQMWIGTQKGVLRYDYLKDYFHFYSSLRYFQGTSEVTALCSAHLNGNKKRTVHKVNVGGISGRTENKNNKQKDEDEAEGIGIIVATTGGFSKLKLELWNMQRKIDFMQSYVTPRHNRHGLVADCGLKRFGDISSWFYKCGDNDGQHTSFYIVSQAYRYAVTRDPLVKQKAWKHVQALQMLHNMTGIKGFFGRTFFNWAAGETCEFGNGRWYNSSVMKGWTWKGDTSSDEVSGHMLGLMLTYDLIAETAEELKLISDLILTPLAYIIENNYTFVGPDGNPTTWGRWNPFYLNQNKSSSDDRGLNSFEIVSWLVSAFRISNGDELFLNALYDLCNAKNQYCDNLLNAFTQYPYDIVHFDRRLAFNSYEIFYWSINKMSSELLNKLPAGLISNVDSSIERAMEILLPERNSPFNAVYLASKLNRSSALKRYLNEHESDLTYYLNSPKLPRIVSAACRDCNYEYIWKGAVQSLEEWSLDQISFPVDLTIRRDISINLYDPKSCLNVLPMYERVSFTRWSENLYSLKGGSGYTETEPVPVLEGYWRLKYYNFNF